MHTAFLDVSNIRMCVEHSYVNAAAFLRVCGIFVRVHYQRMGIPTSNTFPLLLTCLKRKKCTGTYLYLARCVTSEKISHTLHQFAHVVADFDCDHAPAMCVASSSAAYWVKKSAGTYLHLVRCIPSEDLS